MRAEKQKGNAGFGVAPMLFTPQNQITLAMTAATTMRESGCVLPASVMAGISYVALTVPGLIRMKVIERALPTIRHRSRIPVMRIVTVIDMAIEAMRTVEPGTGSNENAASKPIRPVVAVRSAWVRGIVEVAVRADRRDPNVDGYLSGYDCTAGEEHPST